MSLRTKPCPHRLRAPVLGLLLALYGAGGCNVIGLIAGKTIPPPKAPAAFTLAAVPTAVVVRSEESISGEQGPLDAETVAITLERALAPHLDAPIVQEAMAYQRVEVVINPPSTEGALGSNIEQGHASALVRVVNEAGEELWPQDASTGFLVVAQTPRIATNDPAELRRATLRTLAVQVAALFHAREMQPDE